MNEKEKNKKQKGIIILIIILLFLICSAAVVYIVWEYYNNYVANENYNNIIESYYEENSGENNIVDNPIDFESLKSVNDDVYAWVKVPNTKVNYPVAQSQIDDNYYLNKSIEKKYLFAGMIYTQSCNKLDFSDPVTVLYGHNMRNGTMFASLHSFENKNFFDKNSVFYIYTEKHVLTYKIVSAFKYDNRHIMNSFNFANPDDLAEFQQTVSDPDSLVKNVRKGIKLDENSKIVVLSTCIGNRNARYLVCGVLEKDEQTR